MEHKDGFDESQHPRVEGGPGGGQFTSGDGGGGEGGASEDAKINVVIAKQFELLQQAVPMATVIG